MKKSVGKKVHFELAAKPGSEVFVAGSFNDWDPKRYPMTMDIPQIGLFKVDLRLPEGRHEYKFVVNGEWRTDPNCPDWVLNQHGTANSVITV